MNNILIIALFTAATLLLTFNIRAMRIKDWRARWRTALKDDPAGLEYFALHVPKFNTMLWKFWKPIKDSAWIPARMRAAKYMAAMDSETRANLIKWANTNPDIYGQIENTQLPKKSNDERKL